MIRQISTPPEPHVTSPLPHAETENVATFITIFLIEIYLVFR